MNKNKINKFALFAGTVVLSGTITYGAISNVFEVKPFTQNNYPVHKIDLKEYRSTGVKNNTFYSKNGDFSKYILTNSVIIKTPYYTDKQGNIKRDVYTYDIKNLSQDDINFIIENSNNIPLILNQEYMSVINNYTNGDYSLLSDISELHYINSETTNANVSNNNFEIYYAEYDANSHEVIYYNSKYLDNILSASYVTFNVVFASIITKLYDKIPNKKKERVKIFNNKKGE